MKYSKYYTIIALIITVVPYGWGVPRYLPLAGIVSVGLFFLLRKIMLGLEPDVKLSGYKRFIRFLALMVLILGHASFVRLLILLAKQNGS